MGTLLFDRTWEIRIGADKNPSDKLGGLNVEGLRVSFHVKKTVKREPNTCELKIWNLSEESRAKLSAKVLNVSVNAGYKDTGLHQLYLGQVRAAVSRVDGPDIVTTVSSGDGEKAQQGTWINQPVGALTPALQVFQAIVGELGKKGVGAGNAGELAALLAAKGVVTFHPTGGVLSGNASMVLTDLCRSAGIEWSIQDGVIQFVDVVKPRSNFAVKLSPATGLKGSPTVNAKGDVDAKCALIPGLRPGDLVVFDSVAVKGGYKISEIEYVGDSHGDEWDAEIKCTRF
jgi:hypothetical protein